MRQILNLTVVATLFFLIKDDISLGNGYGYAGVSYGETIINVYEISSEVITESKRLEGYKSISAHNSYAASDENTILDTISFVEN